MATRVQSFASLREVPNVFEVCGASNNTRGGRKEPGEGTTTLLASTPFGTEPHDDSPYASTTYETPLWIASVQRGVIPSADSGCQKGTGEQREIVSVWGQLPNETPMSDPGTRGSRERRIQLEWMSK